jgi:CDP-glucose 4,6-dehydratase
MDELKFFNGRRVFITGHTGFKGSWLTLWLLRQGALVTGFSLDVPTSPSLFETLGLEADIKHLTGDVRDADYLTSALENEQPEIVFHLAAQPLVRRSFHHPKETFDINVGGTVNLLEAVRKSEDVRAVVCITSDKCYDPRGWQWGHREDDPLGGHDPYSASKAAAEMAVAAYRESFFSLTKAEAARVGLATVRAGNVIGGGDWAPDRLVPDCIRALMAEEPIVIRHPEAVRPWQHVLETLAGYLLLAKRLWNDPEKYSAAWNFGPTAESARPVAHLVQEIIRLWGRGQWKRADRAEFRETPCLRLCSDKAMSLLVWRPQWNLPAALKRTVEWYRAFYWHAAGSELGALCERQIDEYENRWNGSVSSIRPSDISESAGCLTSPKR